MAQLFETYCNNASNVDLKKTEKEFLCDFISKMCKDEDKEAIFILIYYFYLHENGDKTNLYPYKCKKNKARGLNFSLTKLPYKLRQILYKFCKTIECNENELVVEINIKKRNVK